MSEKEKLPLLAEEFRRFWFWGVPVGRLMLWLPRIIEDKQNTLAIENMSRDLAVGPIAIVDPHKTKADPGGGYPAVVRAATIQTAVVPAGLKIAENWFMKRLLSKLDRKIPGVIYVVARKQDEATKEEAEQLNNPFQQRLDEVAEQKPPGVGVILTAFGGLEANRDEANMYTLKYGVFNFLRREIPTYCIYTDPYNVSPRPFRVYLSPRRLLFGDQTTIEEMASALRDEFDALERRSAYYLEYGFPIK